MAEEQGGPMAKEHPPDAQRVVEKLVKNRRLVTVCVADVAGNGYKYCAEYCPIVSAC